MSSTFCGRFQNFLLNAIVRFLQEIYVDRIMDEMVQKAVDGKYQVLPVKKLRQRATLALINYNEMIDGMEQLPANVIGVGGLHIQEPKKLSMVSPTIIVGTSLHRIVSYALCTPIFTAVFF